MSLIRPKTKILDSDDKHLWDEGEELEATLTNDGLLGEPYYLTAGGVAIFLEECEVVS